jgi:hypothetical protein
MKTKQTIERMVSTVAAVMVMAGLFAPAAMTEEVVRDQRDGSEEAAPIVRDHRDDGSSTIEEEEEPYKDPGIRQCDITPVECEDTDESRDDHDDGNSSAHPDANEPNPVEEESEGKASALGAVKAGTLKPLSAPADEAGQTADSGINGDDTCPFDGYMYIEELDVCTPASDSDYVLSTIFGDTPWPDSLGGYLGLAGDLVEDPLLGAGVLSDAGLGYVGDALVEFGDTGNFVGWPFQGLGYTLGFLGDVSGALGTGLGEAAGAVADGVGEVVDAIGDAAEDAWDEVTSWF